MKRIILSLFTVFIALAATAATESLRPAGELAATPAAESAAPATEQATTPATTPATEPAAEPVTTSSATTTTFATQAAAPAMVPLAFNAETPVQQVRKQRFLPTRRRMDREINKLKFAYKGEVMMGLTASYGTLSSDDTDIMLILDNINAEGTVATVKPFVGYFYRDNNCIGVRFGYRHMGGTLNNARFDAGESNDILWDVPYFDSSSDNYSFGVFHRSYAGLDPKGRFGLFAEFELAVSTGSSKFAYEADDLIKYTYSDNMQVKLSFNPGAAVYIFPNVCATLSFGLGGIQYSSVKQKDENGNKIGSRKASNMRFRLNIAAINFGMTIHLWDKKKN